jgi:pseudaminic acid cytidylyltransferase
MSNCIVTRFPSPCGTAKLPVFPIQYDYVVPNIVIIPARSGSTRVPDKNIYMVRKVPMLVQTIETLKSSSNIDRIVVDTDSELYADLARAAGAEIAYIRKKEFSQNQIGIKSVMMNSIALLSLDSQDNVCCVYATNPLLDYRVVDLGYEIFQNKTFSGYVTPVVKFGFPPQRAIRINLDGSGSMRLKRFMYSQSQNLEAWFHETAQFWWARADTWLSPLGMQEHIYPIVVKEFMQQDIDTLDDVHLALAKFEYIKSNPEIYENEIDSLRQKYLS